MSMSSIRAEGPLYQIFGPTLPVLTLPYSVQFAKRCIDLAFSVVGLLLLALLLPVVALILYADSPGPIFYRQRRASALAGRPRSGRCCFAEFDMLKFRTMQVDAEVRTGAVLAEENDPRVTSFGRFLRKSRLDELPQFWNVFRGEMSVVGPRPERLALLENLALAIPFFEERMRDCKPGITGLAQVSLTYSGRAPAESRVAELEGSLANPFDFELARGAPADDLRTKLLFDLAYVASLERFSTFILTELWVLMRTPLVMLKGLGR